METFKVKLVTNQFVVEDTTDKYNVKIIMLKGEKGDSGSGTGTIWGGIEGTITNQTDLINLIRTAFENYYTKSQTDNLLGDKVDTASLPSVIGTITSVKMNGSTISSSGEVDLGTVITEHQDISGKLNTSSVKTSTNTNAGNVYDVTYINSMLGNIETLLGGI